MKLFALLVLCISVAASAESDQLRFQDWDVTDIKGNPIAMTFNNSGNALAFRCDRSKDVCNLLLVTDQFKCSESTKVAVLVGIDSEVFPNEILCGSFNGQNMNLFTTNFEIIAAMKRSKIFSVAIYLSSGEYSIMRFSLNGFTVSSELAAMASKKRDQLSDTVQ